jgi:hypothetical protein
LDATFHKWNGEALQPRHEPNVVATTVNVCVEFSDVGFEALTLSVMLTFRSRKNDPVDELEQDTALL